MAGRPRIHTYREIENLRRAERAITASTNWQDMTCRDFQIDTPELNRRIDAKLIVVPRHLRITSRRDLS
jgi:hypothetical protein